MRDDLHIRKELPNDRQRKLPLRQDGISRQDRVACSTDALRLFFLRQAGEAGQTLRAARLRWRKTGFQGPVVRAASAQKATSAGRSCCSAWLAAAAPP